MQLALLPFFFGHPPQRLAQHLARRGIRPAVHLLANEVLERSPEREARRERVIIRLLSSFRTADSSSTPVEVSTATCDQTTVASYSSTSLRIAKNSSIVHGRAPRRAAASASHTVFAP